MVKLLQLQVDELLEALHNDLKRHDRFVGHLVGNPVWYEASCELDRAILVAESVEEAKQAIDVYRAAVDELVERWKNSYVGEQGELEL